ncbi:MAG: LssY C-terminal domain-containing protein [Usitatibacter sp.]
MLASSIFYSIFFLAAVLVPAALILCVLVLLDHRHAVWRVGARIGHAIGGRLAAWAPARRALAGFPRTVAFAEERLDARRPWGLSATVAGIALLMSAWLFFGVLQDITAKDPLVTLDLRIHNMAPLFRTQAMTWVMLRVTELGSAAVLATLCFGLALLAIARARPRPAVAFVVAPLSAGLVSFALKVAVGHARPMDSLVQTDTASFPSGHTIGAAVVYGLLLALLLRSGARRATKVAGATLLNLVIVGVGISRLYLGAHWPSDLLGSLAVALALLCVILFFLQFEAPLGRIDAWKLPSGTRAARVAGIASLGVAVILAATLDPRVAGAPIEPPAPRDSMELEAFLNPLPRELARFSEDLVGGKMEPISLIFVGSRADLERAFGNAGWSLADAPTPVRVVQEMLNAATRRPDPNAPVTPAFLASWPQTLAFERPDERQADINRRHHARVWQTSYCVAPGCRLVWVATASFDEGVEISAKLHLPTHRIDPDVDRERALIASALAATGAIARGHAFVTSAMRGTNAAGDPFATDGRAVVLLLPAS